MKKQSGFKISFSLFRVFIAILMIIHGIARIYYDGVTGFGQFLNEKGFYIGLYLAYAITIFEIMGGLFIIFGKFSKWIAPFFMIELLMGVILVHANFGWFVVGHSLNGVEYSLCLILCFFLIWAEDYFKPAGPN